MEQNRREEDAKKTWTAPSLHLHLLVRVGGLCSMFSQIIHNYSSSHSSPHSLSDANFQVLHQAFKFKFQTCWERSLKTDLCCLFEIYLSECGTLWHCVPGICEWQGDEHRMCADHSVSPSISGLQQRFPQIMCLRIFEPNANVITQDELFS